MEYTQNIQVKYRNDLSAGIRLQSVMIVSITTVKKS